MGIRCVGCYHAADARHPSGAPRNNAPVCWVLLGWWAAAAALTHAPPPRGSAATAPAADSKPTCSTTDSLFRSSTPHAGRSRSCTVSHAWCRCRTAAPAGSTPHLSFNDSWHSRGAVTAATAWCTRSTRAGRSPASSTAPRTCMSECKQTRVHAVRHSCCPHSASQEIIMPTCTCCDQLGSCLCQLLGKCMALFATTARGNQ